MGRGAERTITCVNVGCGYTYTHKRMDGKGWQRERMLHVATGQCARRVNASMARDVESRANSMVSRKDVLALIDPIYDLLRVADAKLESLKTRVEKRLESRKKRKFYIERDSKPKPWKMREAVKGLLASELHVAEAFKETMTKRYAGGWSWQVALSTWFHFILDQCCSDPVLLMAKDEVRFHDDSGQRKVTKLQYFRCFGRYKKWDPLDEGLDGFFVGFWYPMVAACRKLSHWDNRIIFDLPCSEQARRTFNLIWHDGFAEMREPDVARDRSIAQVFYDVLLARKRQRHADAQDDEKNPE